MRNFIPTLIIHIIMSCCLLSSSIALFRTGQIYYLIFIAITLLWSIKKSVGFSKNNNKGLYIAFIISCFFSSAMNFVFDYRLFFFPLILITFTPILDSYKIFIFRQRFLYISLLFFPIISIASVYCYHAGINLAAYEPGNVTWDFSAFFGSPMWLAAAVGIGNIVSLWLFINSNKLLFKIFFFITLLLSLYISVVSASRSALVASLISIVIYLYIIVRQKLKLILYLTIIVISSPLYMYYYLEGSERIQAKMEGNKEAGTFGSRSQAWEYQWKHYKETPIWGYGFSVSYHNDKRDVGRAETGSGWLSVLFQMGIIGLIIILLLTKKCLYCIKYLYKDNILQLLFIVFMYICMHSFFEGYILTSMYYLCILFWGLLGYLHCYPYYLRKYNSNNDIFISKIMSYIK